MTTVGVDACSSGWFAGILNEGTLTTRKYDKIRALLEDHDDAEQVLIDIPVGLPKTERRTCDEDAKDLLGCRGISVFHPPCRAVLDADHDTHERASGLNRKEMDNGLSKQAWNILPKIREVHGLIGSTDRTGMTIYESHPELCFYAFNDQNPIAYSKQSERGREKRREVLREELAGSDQAYEEAIDDYYRKDVARDDILDTLVLTAAARTDSLVSIPDDRNHREQRKVIVYPDPNR